MKKDPEEPELKENKEKQEPEVSASDPSSEILQGYGCQVSDIPKPPEEDEG